MNSRISFIFLTVLGIFLSSYPLQASHLVIGELSYKKIGSGNDYEITLTYYRDCRPPSLGGGNPVAINSDEPAYLSIFVGSSLYLADSVFPVKTENLSSTTDCRLLSQPIQCINKIVFQKTYSLPPSAQPYTIINQRCCLNESIENVISPGSTGFSFSTSIPPSLPNSSAIFKPAFSNIICVHDNLTIDHAATDPDGDSLTYAICDIPQGGEPMDPKPYLTQFPTLTTIPLASGYTAAQPMHQIYINPTTGLITIEPSQVGHFLVCICCYEWRNGVIINTTRRAFVYQVNDCNLALNSNIPCDWNVLNFSSGNVCQAHCNSNLTVTFEHNSTGQAVYHWDFGVANLQTDTSSLPIPTYQFPTSGYYTITLTTTLNGCTDEAQQTIYVGNDVVQADFTTSGLLCTGLPIQLHDQSSSANDSISSVHWLLSNSSEQHQTYGKDSSVIFQTAGDVHIVHTAFNSHGCYDTSDGFITIQTPHISAYSDTTVTSGSSIQLIATGGLSYYWTYSGINDIIGSSQGNSVVPSTQKPGKTDYIAFGTDNLGCIGTDTVRVVVTSGAQFIIPTAFSPNGDGINDWLQALHSGYTLQSFKIFNRWGQEVFTTKNIEFTWTGEYKGEALAMDTYYWVAKVYNEAGKLEIKKGDVLIVR